MSEFSLKAMAEAAQRGDRAAVNILLDRYRPRAYSISLQLCGNKPCAEDAVQDAFLLAYTKLFQLRDTSAVVAWLDQIVRNCCYQSIRKEKMRLREGLDGLPLEDGLIIESFERHYDRLADRDTLYACLSQLPEVLRSTMLLRYFSDHNSYEEVAAVLGIPVGTVRSRLNEGRKQLQRYWQAAEHVGGIESERASYYNALYSDLFRGVYTGTSSVDQLMEVIDPALRLIFTSGKSVQGRDIFEESIYDDFEHGSSICRVDSCISSGSITVMNVSFENSSEHPDHCPPGSYLVMHRKNGMMTSMRLYHALRSSERVKSQFA